MSAIANSQAKKINTKKSLLVLVSLVELVIIIFMIYNNDHKALIQQRKFDQDFIQLLDLSNNALELVAKSGDTPDLRSNMVSSAASSISSAYSLVRYTSYTKENIAYGGLLENYKSVFINVPIGKLIANSGTFASYMKDILIDTHSKEKVDKFTDYLITFQIQNAVNK